MNGSGLKQKLTSRKLWAAIIAALVTIISAFFYDELTEDAVDVIIGGIGALCAYIFGEGAVDVARIIGGIRSISIGEVDFSNENNDSQDTCVEK